MKKILFVIILVLIAYFGIDAYSDTYRGQDLSDREVSFTISQGEGTASVIDRLKQQEIIESTLLFRSYLKSKGLDTSLIAGNYSLNPSHAISEIAAKITSGDVDDSISRFTIKEGWDIFDIANEFELRGIAQREELMELIGFPAHHYQQDDSIPQPTDFSNEYPILSARPEYLSYEGYIFPDTYFIDIEAGVEPLVKKAFENLENKITDEMLADIKKQGKTLHEILTLASVIEKEAPKGDYAKVAGVFYNRLRDGIALQSDATVNYVTGKQTDRPTYEDIEVDNLYNTYEYPGLPPGPISNPGIEAIRAAIYPESHNYYYFLNPPGGGKLYYAETFEGHKRNRELYLD